MTSSVRARRHPDVTVKELGNETLLYAPGGQAIHVLNATAYLIWQLCDGKHTLEEMEQALREAFAVPDSHDVRQDVEQTLAELARKGLIALFE